MKFVGGDGWRLIYSQLVALSCKKILIKAFRYIKFSSGNTRPAMARLHLYRYQILPVDRNFQGDLYGPQTLDDLLDQKNQIFRDALDSPKLFFSSRSETKAKLVYEDQSFSLYMVAANRSQKHETKDFLTEQIENWPKVLVAVWNEPDKQLVAVQHRASAFQDTDAVMKLIFDPIAPLLAERQLVAMWEPLFERSAFWDLARRYEGKIQEVDFELITPNMANISKVLPENLRDFAKLTNAVKSHVTLACDPSSALKIAEQNEMLSSLVDYASQGGGDISIRLHGFKKKLHTARSIREIEVDEVSVQGNPQQVAEALKGLLA